MIPDDFKEDHIDANFLNYQYSFLDRCAKKLGLIDYTPWRLSQANIQELYNNARMCSSV